MSKALDLLKANMNDIFKPVAVLLTICIIIPLALSVTNKVTAKKIEELKVKTQNETMSKLIKADEYVSEKYNKDDADFSYNIAKKNGEIKGYIFANSAKGYGGDITVMTALDDKGKILEIAVTDASNETPGLGQNVTKEDFYGQYKDKHDGVYVVKGGNGGNGNTVDAVTGATISSKAVNTAVSEAIENFKLITVKGEVALDEK